MLRIAWALLTNENESRVLIFTDRIGATLLTQELRSKGVNTRVRPNRRSAVEELKYPKSDFGAEYKPAGG